MMDRAFNGAKKKAKLLAKDVRLFRENTDKAGTPNAIGTMISKIYDGCEEALPGSDFTNVYKFICDGGEKKTLG